MKSLRRCLFQRHHLCNGTLLYHHESIALQNRLEYFADSATFNWRSGSECHSLIGHVGENDVQAKRQRKSPDNVGQSSIDKVERIARRGRRNLRGYRARADRERSQRRHEETFRHSRGSSRCSTLSDTLPDGPATTTELGRILTMR